MDERRIDVLIGVLDDIADELDQLNTTLKKFRNGSYCGPEE